MHDARVVQRTLAAPELAAQTDKPWLVCTRYNRVFGFDTELEAMAFQKGFRVSDGLNPETGEVQEGCEGVLVRIAETAIAHLRKVIVEPAVIELGNKISIELWPASGHDDRVLIARKGWGYTVVNYTSEGLIYDVYPEGDLPEPVDTGCIYADDLVDTSYEVNG